FLVHFAITNAVSDVIDSGAQHALGVIQHDDVRRGAIAVLVSFINRGAVNFRCHLLPGPAEIVDPHFYKVRFVSNQFVDALASLFRSLDRDRPWDGRRILDRSGNIQARRGYGSRLGTIFPQSKLLVPTQAEDSSDSIAQVKPQLI